MKFQKGHKFAKGGRRPGAGRKSRAVLELKALSAELAKEGLEKALGSAIDTYIAAATGLPVGLGRNKKVKVDLQTCRHFIERFVPPATRRIEISDPHTAESFFQRVQAEAERERAQKGLPAPEGETVTEEEPETIH